MRIKRVVLLGVSAACLLSPAAAYAEDGQSSGGNSGIGSGSNLQAPLNGTLNAVCNGVGVLGVGSGDCQDSVAGADQGAAPHRHGGYVEPKDADAPHAPGDGRPAGPGDGAPVAPRGDGPDRPGLPAPDAPAAKIAVPGQRIEPAQAQAPAKVPARKTEPGLPVTGAAVGVLAGAGALLLLGGGVVFVVARRRRRAFVA